MKWPDFLSAPEPLSAQQRGIVVVLTTIVSISRFWGRARTPWDWDEMLFSLALDDFDVPSHHPHPPGFPLFIAAAKLVKATGLSHFHALQSLSLVAGILLLPAMLFFCRELRMRPDASIAAALVLAFLPNVWFFGETAFSDVPSIVLVVASCALLLRGCRDGTSFILGAILLGIAAGFRPQNLTIGFAAAMIATWYQLRARKYAVVLIGLVAGAGVVFAAYAGAANASGGWKPFRAAVDAHQVYITSVDSFRNPNRPPLRALIDDFFVRPFRGPVVNTPLTLLALISMVYALIRRRWPVLIAIASFAPFAIAAWLVLDHMSASRFSVGYMPLLAVLAADGAFVAALLMNDARRRIAYALVAIVVVTMIAWTAPAIDVPRRSDSPPVQAVKWVRANVPRSAEIITDGGMGPFAELFLADYALRSIPDGVPIARFGSSQAWFLAEGSNRRDGAHNFAWERDRLWNVARHRYFETSVAPVLAQARFESGWYGEEREGNVPVRWMAQTSITQLPAAPPRARLRIRLFVPLHVLGAKPSVEVALNGESLERFEVGDAYTEKVWDVQPNTDAPNVLALTTDRSVNPARQGVGNDQRDLGMRLDNLEWLAIRN